ncbi:protein FAM8A1-like [Ptychodera flava]|uniref:protein FAM8A1-like n=1 Tax=Ptychodera flava TaxID=63121 RepID=UPI00396A7538
MDDTRDEVRHRRKGNSSDSGDKDDSDRQNMYSNYPYQGGNYFTGNEGNSSTGSVQTRPSSREYTEAVSQWLWQYRMHYAMWSAATAQYNPFNMMAFPSLSTQFGQHFSSATMPNGSIPPQTNINGTASPTPGVAGTPSAGQRQQRQEATQTSPLQGKEYNIPSVYRRVAAEFIDFVILFTIKVLITLFIMEYTDALGDQTDFTMKFLLEEFDEEATVDDLQQMLFMALVYRIGVCLYETFFLRRGVRYFGGATPGKYILGLRVVASDRVLDLGEGKVLVFSGEDIGVWNAMARSLIKNFSMAFFFPVYLTILFYQHNRGAYDIIAGTLVVSGPRYQRYGPQNIRR